MRVNPHLQNAVVSIDTDEVYLVENGFNEGMVRIHFIREAQDKFVGVPGAKYEDILKALGLEKPASQE